MSEPSLIETAVDVTMAALVAASAGAFGPSRKRGGRGANRDLSKCGTTPESGSDTKIASLHHAVLSPPTPEGGATTDG